MELSIALGFLFIGMFFGSFYHVVGYRMSKGESIVYPGSHCPECNHPLSPLELIPVISFLIQGGKCRKCKTKISWLYPFAELICGLLFMLAYISFGFTWQLLIAITFISMLIIVFFSDCYYMIIEDKVLVFFGILLIIELYFINGFNSLLYSLLDGVIAFVVMLIIKLLGDFAFKKESMGWGDIKLMLIIGLVLGYEMSLMNIFLAAIIGLPVSLIVLLKDKDHAIPFGPMLSIGAVIILLLQIDFTWVMEHLFIRWY